MKVLLTNDDGIEAVGLRTMRRALLEVPGVELPERDEIAAPVQEQLIVELYSK